MKWLCLAGLVFALTLGFCRPALALSSAELPILDPGQLELVAAAGPISLARQWTWGYEMSLRVGVWPWVELAAPLAIGIKLIDAGPGSAIYVGAGVVDFFVTSKGRMLLSPAVILAGQARLGKEAALRGAFDISGVEPFPLGPQHPGWVRGSLALILDLGPWVTVAAGFSYQRLVFEGEPPRGTRQSGWVGDARFSVGAVRSQPFSDLPTLAVHLLSWLDVLCLIRLDVDTDTGTTDARLLAGLGITS